MSIDDIKTETADVSRFFNSWSYRLGMSIYRKGISSFFAAGGLNWLKRKYTTGIDERTGNISAAMPSGALWVHAVSVGEVQSALSLIENAQQKSGRTCVLSTVTPTGRLMADKLTEQSGLDVAKFYNPWDTEAYVTSALDTLKPKAYIAMETERWPIMLAELRKRKIPAFLVNGRLSDDSTARLLKIRNFWRGVLCCFTRLLVRFDSDKERFIEIGVPEDRIDVTGDCKIDTMLERRQKVDAAKWAHLRNGEPLFVAGSTHKGDDEIVLEAFKLVRSTHPHARLIIVPRHPERALSVVASSLPYGKVDLFTDMTSDWDILVINKIGLLLDLYSIADAVFIGGSLFRVGGQNIMEPALFGVPIAHGPHMEDFPDAPRMDKMGASQMVEDSYALSQAWLHALTPAARAKAQNACTEYFKTVGGASERSWDIINRCLN